MARSSWNKGTRVLLDAGDATPIPEQTPVKTEPLTKENMSPPSEMTGGISDIVRAVLKELGYGEQGIGAVAQGQGGFQDPDKPVSTTGTWGIAAEEEDSSEKGLMSKRPKARPQDIQIVEEPKPIPEDAPINVRNNNLGNIKNVQANLWKGQTNLGTDETFANFKTPELGIRALKKVILANIDATNTFEEYVNRYASEPDEKRYYKQNGKLLPHLQNYAKIIAKSQGISNIKDPIPPSSKRDLLSWIKATAKAEGGQDSLKYFTDDIINKGLKLR